MESEVKDPMTSSAITGDNHSTSSDNESWTILDEDEAVVENVDQNVLCARVDVVQNLAEFSRRSMSPIPTHISPSHHRESDSDIDVIDEGKDQVVSNAESNLESLNSDGIPVGEELVSHNFQVFYEETLKIQCFNMHEIFT